jgi:TRAP-type C4-dicarboxylate transport system permease small subunit
MEGVRRLPWDRALTIEKCILAISKISRSIGMGILLGLALLDTADVIGRYFLNMPITGTQEVSEILLAGIVFFGWGHTQALKRHVAVTFVVSRFPRRLQAIMDLSVSFLMLLFLGLIMWQGIETAMSYRHSNRMIPILNIPIYPFQLFVPFGCLVFCLVLITQIFRLSAEIGKGD